MRNSWSYVKYGKNEKKWKISKWKYECEYGNDKYGIWV
jgi:hypothetical protein